MKNQNMQIFTGLYISQLIAYIMKLPTIYCGIEKNLSHKSDSSIFLASFFTKLLKPYRTFLLKKAEKLQMHIYKIPIRRNTDNGRKFYISLTG